ncbi:MAG: hypothetical protein M3346_01660, partial [Actinomycetota bacterium]|nr:hypothetical protein [Actinomycetota bacterium]
MTSRGRLIALLVVGGIGLLGGALTGLVRPEEPSPIAPIELRSERIAEPANRSPVDLAGREPGPATGASRNDDDAAPGGRRERIERDGDESEDDDDASQGDDAGSRGDDDESQGDDDESRGDDDGSQGDDDESEDDGPGEGTAGPAARSRATGDPSSDGEDDSPEGGVDTGDEGDEDDDTDDEGGD